jgi:5'-nucleotidase
MVRTFSFVTLLFTVISCGISKNNSSSELLEVSDKIEANNDIENDITIYRNQLKESMDYKLSIAEVDFVKGKPNGNLNNLIADIILKAGMSRARIHSIAFNNTICLLNWGGLRAPINKGDITVGSCFEVMPFENEIVIVEMDQDDIKTIAEYLVKTGGHPVSNFSMNTFDDIKVAGNKISEGRYFVITSDYLYNGGDNMTFFKDKKVIKTGYKIRDALIQYFNGKDLIPDVPEKRLKF